MTRKIFISYRRSDSEIVVHRMFDWLVEHFGSDAIFIDIDRIPYGADFRVHITDQIRQASVVLLIIGQTWLETLNSRVNDPDDWLRHEIETAFAEGKDVIPVLVDRTVMPVAKQLPTSIAKLAFLNAAGVSATKDFRYNMMELAERLTSGWGFTQRSAAPDGGRIDQKSWNTPNVLHAGEVLAYLEELDPIRFPSLNDDPEFHKKVHFASNFLTLLFEFRALSTVERQEAAVKASNKYSLNEWKNMKALCVAAVGILCSHYYSKGDFLAAQQTGEVGAKLGSEWADLYLGLMYANGSLGYKDTKRAEANLLRASAKEVALADKMLAIMYEKALIDGRKNMKLAARHFLLSAREPSLLDELVELLKGEPIVASIKKLFDGSPAKYFIEGGTRVCMFEMLQEAGLISGSVTNIQSPDRLRPALRGYVDKLKSIDASH